MECDDTSSDDYLFVGVCDGWVEGKKSLVEENEGGCSRTTTAVMLETE